jgi:hypothetical protein
MCDSARCDQQLSSAGDAQMTDTIRVTHGDGSTARPYHVARSKLFVRERFGKALVHLDTAEIEVNISPKRAQQWVANLYANVFSMEQYSFDSNAAAPTDV